MKFFRSFLRQLQFRWLPVLTLVVLGGFLWRMRHVPDAQEPEAVESSEAATSAQRPAGRMEERGFAMESAGTAEVPEEVRDRLEAEWPGAAVVRVERRPGGRPGTEERVVFVKPPDLPYHLRLGQTVRRTAGGQEELVGTHDTVADHVLIQTVEGLSEEALRDALEPLGLTLARRISRRGLWRVTLENPLEVDAQAEALAALRELEVLAYAEADPIVRTFATPDDPLYLDGSLWGLHNTGQEGGTADADIDGPEGWAVTSDASTVIVGIVDTGIRLTHEDLAANLWVNPAETSDGTDTDGNGFVDDLHGINAIQLSGNPEDDQGHGTHVAGTVGAVGNNGIGVSGVAWNVRLMGLKFLAAAGGGAVSDAVICIDYGVENGAQILNNSWGGGGFSQALLDAVEAARDAGVIFVAAAGNSGTNNDLAPIYPASLPVENMVTVASTTRTDDLSGFSCYGQGTVDLGAPGHDILSTGFESDTSYVVKSGTSMASPHVAGVLALLRAEFPGDTWDQLIHRMHRGTDGIAVLGEGKVGDGGRLNLVQALSAGDNRPVNDDFTDGRVIHGDRAVLRVNLRSATFGTGEPGFGGESAPNTVWYRFTPAASGLSSVTALAGESIYSPVDNEVTTIAYDVIPAVIGVYTGDTLNELTEVDSGADALSFTATEGVTYHIAVAGAGGAEGLVMLEVTGAPSNSTLGNAIELELNSPQAGTNRNALSEPGEPDHAGQPAAASVWYRWTANLTARVAFTTRGSAFDTRAAVYTGPASGAEFADLDVVGENNNAVGTAATFSRVEFQAIAGTTYYFAVDGHEGETGLLTALLALPPVNDRFENAQTLSGVDVSRGVTTLFGSREDGEPQHWPNEGQGETVWYTWTAPENGRTSLDLSGSFFRGIIAVYTGNAVDNLSLVNAPFRLRMVPIPANDQFADAEELLGIRATATGSNIGGTRESGEPGAGHNGGPSVWHRWTAPADGEYGIYGERLNKAEDRWILVLNLFTGTAVDSLTHIREDQHNGIGRDAFLRFTATAGTTYYLQVTGLTDDAITGGVGPYRLDLRPLAEHAPENDHFADAIDLDGSRVFNFRTQNYGATGEPGEPAHSGYAPDLTLWWRFAVPPGQAGRYVAATTLSEGSIGATVYRADNPAAPSLDALTQVGSSVEFANQNFPNAVWEAEEGAVYYIAVDRYVGNRGRVVFNFQKVPDNRTFANAEVIPAEGLETVVCNFGSEREDGEPTGGFFPAVAGHRSLWWTWTAPASGRYQTDTIGSRLGVYEDAVISAPMGNPTILGLDTLLGVYTGSAVDSLTAVATNSRIATYSGSNWSFQSNSRLEFDAVAGTTYHIMVSSHAGGQTAEEREQNTHQGEITFRFRPVQPPGNDDFARAAELSGTEQQVTVTNLGATQESGEPNHGGISGGRSLWWRWTAPESGPFIVSTAGNLFDDYHSRRTGIGVYTGTAVNALSVVGSNQNGAGLNTGDATWSAVQFHAVAGTTYYFGVDAIHAGNLSFMLTRPAVNDDFDQATVMAGSRWTATGHNLLSSVEPGESKIESFFNPPATTDETVRSVWWRWTAPVSGIIHLDTLGSQNYNVLGVYTGSALGALTPVVTTPNSGSGVLNGEAPVRQRSSNQQATFEAVAGTTYHITVQGAGYVMASSGPILLQLEGPPAVPFAPENFTALRTGPSRIDLSWDDIAVDEEFYEIQRSADGVAWSSLHETNPDAAGHTDFDTPEGADYFYRLRAVNSVGQSAWVHAEVTVPQPPAMPGTLTVEGLSASDLGISWEPPATAESQWLERSSGGASGPWTVLNALLPGTASGYTDTGLAADTVYHYRLRASNPLGHSEWATASGMTQAAGATSIAMPDEISETAGSFTATVSRAGTIGSQMLFLRSGDARLAVSGFVTIPDGQDHADFTVTVLDDGIVNESGTGTVTAFAPDAWVGESFTGEAGTELGGQDSGWGWGGNWMGVNASPVLVEPSLAYEQNGTIGSPGSRAARLSNAGAGGQAYRAFADKFSSGSVWVSALLYRDSTNWGTQLMVRENPGSGNWGRVRYENNTNHWMLEASGGSTVQLLAENPRPRTFFVVMEFDFTQRKIRAWMDPDVSGTLPAGAEASGEVDMAANFGGINRLDFSGYSNADQFDEIRVAGSFADLYGGVTVSRAVRIVDGEAPEPPGPMARWRLEHFFTTEPAGPAAPDADPDGDRVLNLMEYALGGDPWQAHTAPRGELGFMDWETERYVTYRIERNPDATDIVFAVQTTPDLLGEWQGGSEHVLILEDSPGLLRVRLTTPLSAETLRFFRLAVQEGP